MTDAEFKKELVRAMRSKPTLDHPVIEELFQPHANHPLIRLVGKQVYQLTRMFERYVAGIFYRSDVGEFRRKLAENLYEEVTGALSKTDGHLELMRRFIFAIGVTPEELDAEQPIEEARALIAYRSGLLDDPARFHEAVAAVMIASESQTIQRKNGKVGFANLSQAYGLGEYELTFFAVHAEEDVQHVADGLELCCRVCTTEQKQRDAIEAVQRTASMFYAFYDGIQRRYEATGGAPLGRPGARS